jgi:bifunctional non-homologous end joining protein LigD
VERCRASTDPRPFTEPVCRAVASPRNATSTPHDAGIPKGIDGWEAEPKLDGWRARVLVDGDELQVRTRSGRVITESVPSVQGLEGLRAVLDGELVADAGRLSDSYRLGPALAVKRGRKVLVAFVAFDVFWQDGEMLVDRPWSER